MIYRNNEDGNAGEGVFIRAMSEKKVPIHASMSQYRKRIISDDMKYFVDTWLRKQKLKTVLSGYVSQTNDYNRQDNNTKFLESLTQHQMEPSNT